MVHAPLGPQVGVVDLARKRAAMRRERENEPLSPNAADEIYDGPLHYVRTDGDEWETGGLHGHSGGPIPVGSPLWFFELFDRLRPAAVDQGQVVHEGEELTRYGVQFEHPPVRTSDIPRLLKRLGGIPRDIEHAGRPPIDGDVWLDARGRIRLIATAITPPPPMRRWMPRPIKRWIRSMFGSAADPLWEVTQLWDFGLPVSITPPPAAEFSASSASHESR